MKSDRIYSIIRITLPPGGSNGRGDTMMFFGFLIVIFAVAFFLKPDILKSRMTISSSYDKEMRVLRERLANGEISIEQYEQLKKALSEEK
ncbi:conserved hypothetical protein [Mesotoga infera]|nr:conserved hypothetical protein [Mesotoga infera]